MTKQALWMGIVLSAATGCVLESQHNKVIDDLLKCQKAHAGAEAEMNKRSGALEQELARAKAALEAKEKEVQQLKGTYAEKLKVTQEELDELRKQRAGIEERLAQFKALTAKFKSMIDAGNIKVYMRRGRMIVALPSSVLFPSGKAELSKRGMQTLKQVAVNLKDFSDRRFLVAGHTDNVPIGEAGFKDNWELSAARALTVTRFMVENGVDSKNLAAAGYGEFDAVQSNKTARGRQQNRRIELILEPNLAELPNLPGT